MKLYQDTEHELFMEDYKPLPKLSKRSLVDLYELKSNLEAAQENGWLSGSDLLAMALDLDIKKVNLYIHICENKAQKAANNA